MCAEVGTEAIMLWGDVHALVRELKGLHSVSLDFILTPASTAHEAWLITVIAEWEPRTTGSMLAKALGDTRGWVVESDTRHGPPEPLSSSVYRALVLMSRTLWSCLEQTHA